jgi:hypothetical protein
MTAVEVLYRYATPPTESALAALASTRGVYGIRRLSIDPDPRTLLVEFDATRLNAAAVTALVRLTGLEVAANLPISLAAAQPGSLPATMA